MSPAQTWVSCAKYPAGEHPFPLQNLPYGVFSYNDYNPRVGIAIGDNILDLSVLHTFGLLDGLGYSSHIFSAPDLNAVMGLSKAKRVATRQRISELLEDGKDSRLMDNSALREKALVPLEAVRMHLPAKIGDYTDFYASRDHATNVGIMIRGKDNALQANWLHLPVGYHGRASSVVVSGTEVRRPCGQLQAVKEDASKGSIYSPCRLLDFELEMGFFIGGPDNELGQAVTMEEAEDRLFGVVILNDWSARDLQTWEYVPLGPFTAKNFCTSISPWVVTMEALEPFKTAGSEGPEGQLNPVPLPYITDPNYARGSYDVSLEVAIKPEGEASASPVTLSNLRHMYWNAKQQLVHHSVSGCPMKAGDLLGTGTISGPDTTSMGSMLELSWRGSKVIPLVNSQGEGEKERKFLKDGDEVIMTGFAQGDGYRVGFGAVTGKILPAQQNTGAISPPPAPAMPTPSSLIGFDSFKLHSYWRSTSSWRVRIALALKGVDYEYIPVDLAQVVGKVEVRLPQELCDMNAMEQIPVLQARSQLNGETLRLTQSVAILEFLDDITAEDGCHLMPKDPVTRANIRQIVEMVNSGIQPLQNVRQLAAVKDGSVVDPVTGEIKSVDGRGLATYYIQKGLAALEVLVTRLGQGQGKAQGTMFAAGTPFPTMADACLIPQLYNSRRFGIDTATLYPALTAVEAVCASVPAFQKAAPEAQPDAQN